MEGVERFDGGQIGGYSSEGVGRSRDVADPYIANISEVTDSSYNQYELVSRLTPAVAASVSEAVGGPIRWQIEHPDNGDDFEIYTAVGPLGMAQARVEAGKVLLFKRRTDPTQSRCFAETGPTPMAVIDDEGPRRVPGGVDARPFINLDATTVGCSGLLPHRVQHFLQKPFFCGRRIAGRGYARWATRPTRDVHGRQISVFEMVLWVSGQDTVSFCHGWRQALSTGTLEQDLAALAREPMYCNATWWSAPIVKPPTPGPAYAVLGVDPSAAHEAIRARHRELVRKLHPDGGGTTSVWAATRFREVQAAWEAIETPALRAGYNAAQPAFVDDVASIGIVGWWDPYRQAVLGRGNKRDAVAQPTRKGLRRASGR